MNNIKNNIFIDPTSIVEKNVSIGKNTKVWHFSHIQSGSSLGSNCVIGQNVYIAPDVAIGNNVKIQNNVSVYKGVIIEDDVFVGPSAVFTNVINPRSFIERKDEFKNTILKKGCSIGANATIICGNIIGKYALVGAGSVVTKNVDDFQLVFGIPAKHKGEVCECGCKILMDMKKGIYCNECDRKYEIYNFDKIRKIKNEV
jgi:UDP-2-acetamido-3-amino-2,3-dideoxy-glucuronate N-acetyltransferase